MKNLVEQIRERQRSGTEQGDKEGQTNKNTKGPGTDTEPDSKTTNKTAIRKVRKNNDLFGQISTYPKAGKDDPMVHVRLPKKTHRTLLALNAAGISIQQFVLFAIEGLMVNTEIKQHIKQILHDLE